MHFSKAFKRCTAVICIIVIMAVSFSGCQKKYTEKTSFAMGSVLTAKVFTEDTEKGEEIFSLINGAVSDAEAALSNTDDTAEIYTLNKEGKIYASDYLKNVLMDSIMVCNILGRRVDISIGKVTSLWGFNTETPSVPDENEIKKHIENVDIEMIRIDNESTKIEIEDTIELDLGALGKGAACDAAFEATRLLYTPYIITLGGTVLAYGEGPQDGKWTVGIRDPFSSDAANIFAALTLSPVSPKNAVFISTSGSYEKAFTENGKTYHHILDTNTGYPVGNSLVSVTVTAPSGLNADALSTACFIEGITENSLSWLKSFGAEAVFVFSDKTYYVTDDLKEALEITADGYKFKNYNES